MYRLIYASVAATELDTDGVDAILSQAKQRNAFDGLTGLILYHKGAFLQVLEGTRDKVEATYQRISHDPRHAEVELISRGETAHSLFDTWTVGTADPSQLSDDLSRRAMTLIKVSDWLDQETRLVDVEDQDVIYAITTFLRRLGDIDARLDVDFLQCYEEDRRQSA